MPPSVARQFFDGLVSDPRGPVAIRQLINTSDPLFESAWLDGKGEEQPKAGRVPEPKQQERVTAGLGPSICPPSPTAVAGF
jgi:hypothetical protein